MRYNVQIFTTFAVDCDLCVLMLSLYKQDFDGDVSDAVDDEQTLSEQETQETYSYKDELADLKDESKCIFLVILQMSWCLLQLMHMTLDKLQRLMLQLHFLGCVQNTPLMQLHTHRYRLYVLPQHLPVFIIFWWFFVQTS